MVASIKRGQETRKEMGDLVPLFPLLLLSFSFQTSHETLVEAPPIRLRRRRRKLFYLLVLSVYMPHHALPVDPATAIASMVGRRRWWGPWDQWEPTVGVPDDGRSGTDGRWR